MATVIHMIRRRQSFLIKMILFIITATLMTAPAHISVAATDIEGHWAEQSISKWLDEGIVSGYADGSFRPDSPMTKAEFITVLNHIYGFYEATSDNYSDVDENDWFYAQTAIAKNSPYMVWYSDDALDPNEKITRQEVSAMLASIQVLKASDDFSYLSQFTDHQMIPEWSKPYLDACVANGYLSGYPDKCLHPTNAITRAEVMTILNKTTGHLIHQNGTYCADHDVKTYDGNLTINTESASLENMLIKGNLILAAGIGQGDVNLNNITVEGKTIINGGGDHSITFTNSHLGELLVYKQDGRIHVVSAGSTVGNTILMSSASLLSGGDSHLASVQIIGQATTVTLEGNYDQVLLETPVVVEITNGTEIASLDILSGGGDSHITVGTQSRIGKVTFDGPADILGEGSIDSAVINVNGVAIEQSVDNLNVANNVNDFTPNTPPASPSQRNSSNDNTTRDTTAPSGYQAYIEQSVINGQNDQALSFHFEQAEINAAYSYTLSSSGDDNVISGSGTITSADQQVAGIDIHSLSDGTISLTVQLTDTSGNAGNAFVDQVIKDVAAPTDYTAAFDLAGINDNAKNHLSFTLNSAEVGATCAYTISSDGGGTAITGNLSVTDANQQINGIDVSSLSDGTLTLSVILTDPALNAGTATTDTAIKDTIAPSGYSVAINEAYMNNANQNALSFTFSGAEIGAQYEYTLISDGGTGTITDTGTLTSSDQQVAGIDTSTLSDGQLTLSVRLTDPFGNVGSDVNDTVLKDVAAPAGYTAAIDLASINDNAKDNISFTLNSAEVGATCAYTISSDGGGTAITGNLPVTDANQQISGIDVSSLPDGTLTLSVILTDTVLNAGSTTTDTAIKDTVAPNGYSIAIDQTQINSSNKTALAFTFSSAEIGTQFDYSIISDGGTETVTGSGTVTSIDQQITPIDVSSLSDGTLTLSVTLTDSASNTGSASTDTVIKDTIAPSGYSVVIGETYMNNANQNALAFTFSGAEIGAQYEYTLISDGAVGTITDTGTLTSSDQQVSGIDTSSLSDGQLTLSVRLTDPFGNVGSDVDDTVIKDVAAPVGYTAAFDLASINDNAKDNISFTLNSAEVGATCAYTISSDGGGTAITGSLTVTDANQQISGIDVSTLSDGTITLSVILTDPALNAGTATTDTAIKDTVPPNGYSLSIDPAQISASNQAAFAFTFSSAEIGTQFDYSIVSDGGTETVTGSGTVTSANQQISAIDVSSLSDGTLTLSVTLTDSASNTGSASTDTVIKDTIAPSGYSVVISEAYMNIANQNALAFTFSGAEIGAQYEYTLISDGGVGTITDTGTLTSSDQQVSGIDTSTLSDGQLTLSIRLTDSFGNVGGDVNDTVLKDVAVPAGYTAAFDLAGINDNAKDNISFTLNTAEVGTTCAYTISSDGGGTAITGNLPVTDANQQIGGIDVSSLSDGTLTLSVILTDPALNVGTATTDTAIKDTAAPNGYSLSIDQSQINTNNQSALSFTFTGAEIGTQFEYTITSDGNAGASSVTNTGIITSIDQQLTNIDVTGLPDGLLTVFTLLTDDALNVGVASTDTISKDTTAPNSYSVAIDNAQINIDSQTTMSFTFDSAEVGTQYAYTVSSNGGGGTITNTGAVTDANQQIDNIDVSTLPDGLLTLSVNLTDVFNNTGIITEDTVIKDTVAPVGYSAAIDLIRVDASNETNLSFTLTGAEVGAACGYTINSDGGGTPVTGNVPITDANQQITGINVSTISDGTLTLSVVITDTALNDGLSTSDTVIKDTTAPVGYGVSIDNAQINNSNQTLLSFTFSNAEIGTQYTYTITSDGGVGSVTDTGTISTVDQQISGVDVTALPDGTLTLSAILTDTFNNAGGNTEATVLKDVVAPSGYNATFDEAYVNHDHYQNTAFSLSDAEIGATCFFTISSDDGGTPITGNVLVTSTNQQISSLDVSGLSDGTLTLSVFFSDTAQNDGSTITDTTEKDTVMPSGHTVAIDEAQINTGNQDAFSFTFTSAEVGTQYAYTITSDGGAGTVTGTGAVTSANQQIAGIDVTALPDGLLALSVTLTDDALNTSTAVSDQVTKDTTIPSGYSAAFDATVNADNQTNIAFTFTNAEVGTQYEYTIVSDGGGSTITDTGTVTSTGQQITGINVSTLPDGILTLAVKLSDTFGNIGSNVTNTTQKDVIAPAGYAVNIDLPSIDVTNHTNFTFTLSSAEIGTTCLYTVSSSGGGTDVTGNITVSNATEQISGIDVSSLPDGDLTLSVILRDPAQNDGSITSDIVTKDTTAPNGYSVAIDPTAINTGNQNTLSFTFASAEVGTQYAYTIISDGGAGTVTNTGTIATATDQLTNIDVSALPDGILTLSVTLTDASGNVGSEATDTILKDIVAPSGYGISIDLAYVNLTNEASFAFTFDHAEVDATCFYTISSSGGGTPVTGNALITSSDQQMTSLNVSGLSDGTLTLSVFLSDTAQNNGSTITDTTEKDTVMPSGHIVAIDEAQINTGNQDAFSFTFTSAEVGTQYAYTITSDGGAGTVTGTGAVVSANQQITEIDVTTLPDGLLALSVTLTDDALNTSTAVSDQVTKDTTIPSGYSAAFDAPVNADNQTNIAFTFTNAEVGTQYEYTIVSDGGGGTITDTGTVTSTDQQITGINVSTLPDGILTLAVKLSDAFGNIGSNVTNTTQKDVIAPVGYGVSIDLANVDDTNHTNFTFTLNGAEVGATCTYTISSDGGGTDVTGSILITSSDQQISGINVSTLPDGILTLDIALKDTALNTGNTITDTVTKDAEPPSGYSIQFDQNYVNNTNKNAVSLSFASAEIGATYTYTIISDSGVETITDSGTITAEDQQVASIDVSTLSDGTLTVTAALTDAVGHVGSDVTANVDKDVVLPTGYGVSIDQTRINTTNLNQFSFALSNAELGTTCHYTINSDGGGTDLTDSMTITSENQLTSNIDVSTLPDGTLTLSVTLTDAALNEGSLSTDTVVKDTTAPSGYSVSFYQSNIHPQNRSAIAFDFTSAEVGTTYAYTVSSNQGGTPITGNGTVSASSERIGNIDTSGLSDGTITISCFLTDQDNNVGDTVTDTIRKSPYADIEVVGYDIFYNGDGTPSNVPGNGIYTYDGMDNGKPSYIFVKSADDTYLIHWYDDGWGDEWNITNISEGTDYIYYFNQTDNPTPPTGNWYYTTATSTTDPDLTVTVVEP